MKKFVLSCGFLCIAIGLFIFGWFATSNRYSLLNASDGRVFKLDKRTGELVIIRQGQEIPIKRFIPPEAKGPSLPDVDSLVGVKEEMELAISMARDAHTLNPSDLVRSNEDYVMDHIGNQKGDLKILGWKATKVEPRIYDVRFMIERDGKASQPGLGFEVDVKYGMVRKINGDPGLEKKYGYK